MQMKWHTKYHCHQDFLSYFEYEQDYIDAMFSHIVMYNFGEFIDKTMMLNESQRAGQPVAQPPYPHF